MRRLAPFVAIIAAAILSAGGGTARAAALWPAWPPPAASGGQQCRAAIERAEQRYRIPSHLLAAIGRVETGRRGPDGRIDPWPFSINVEGADAVFEDRAAAIAGLRTALAHGARSVDVGCLQVNLMYHPDAFASPEDAFDPWRNADYAARFLVRLHDQTGSWEAATASYHSATPEIGGPYAAKVRVAFADEAGRLPVATAAVTTPTTTGQAIGGLVLPPTRLSLIGPRPGAGMAVAMPTLGVGRNLAAYRRDPVRLAAALR